MLGYNGEAVMAPRSVDVGTGINSFKYKYSPGRKVLNIKMGSEGEDIVRYFSALVRGSLSRINKRLSKPPLELWWLHHRPP
tara:strand:+ start:1525 stop:1767 length:243 start_codon:yes stop_codon:yes gene_type:complete